MGKEDIEKTMEVLKEVLKYCRESGFDEVMVACPNGLEKNTAGWLMRQAGVKGVVLLPDNLPELNDELVGRFIPSEYTWRLPEVSCSTIVYVGPRNRISFRMVRRAVKTCGTTRIVYGLPGVWRTEHVLGFVGKRVQERVQWGINRLIDSCSKAAGSYCPVFVADALASTQQRFNPRVKRQLRRFGHIAQQPLLVRRAFHSKRIVFVNSALAWGGAERQLVNTMVSLKQRGFEDISLVCENLNLSEDHRFFHHQLEDVAVEELGTEGLMEVPNFSEKVGTRLKSAVDWLPVDLAEDVFRYAVHFLKHRPGVVHAWQDATSIKAGLAAVLVGVPRIILSGRNVAPIHFPYYQYYMRPGYRLLAGFSQVRMVNNSQAGARDYEQWLGIRGIEVIYNGLDENFIAPVSDAESAQYRKEVGIPAGMKVVGSIFRMYEEKDPLLWAEAVSEVARKRDDVFFLLVGTGPLKGKLEDLARKKGFAERLILPGTHKNPAVPLAIMDVFLLSSRYEGTPNVLMEAQKLGVPVVSTDAGGVRETLLPGVTGLVVQQRTPTSLADAVLKILNDPSWRMRVQEKGPDFIQSRFGLDRMIRETLELYGIKEPSMMTAVS